MQKRRVWRYKCEFCKKANCSSYHIAKHEKGCTNNPNRVCRMCNFAAMPDGYEGLSLAEVIAQLPEIDLDSWTDKALGEKWLESLRVKMGNCPACILAVMRQAPTEKIPSFVNFDYKTEAKAFWKVRELVEAV